MNEPPRTSKLAMTVGLSLLAVIVSIAVSLAAKAVCVLFDWHLSFWLLACGVWLAFEILLVGSWIWAGEEWDH